MSQAPYRVLIADDSLVIRSCLKRVIAARPEFRLVGEARNGEDAQRQVQGLAAQGEPVEIVLLDVEMPVLDGLAALPGILAIRPAPQVVMCSTLTTRGASVSLEALRKGAADYIGKPSSVGDLAQRFQDDLVAKLLAWGSFARRRAAHRSPAPAAARPEPLPAAPLTRLLRPWGQEPEPVLAIASSTGGPQALHKLLGDLAGIRLGPVFITQHMPPHFTAMLAQQLGRIAGRPCAEAQDGAPVRAGEVYVAPGDRHLLVEGRPGQTVLKITQDPPENFCRPAADPMLRSLAAAYGRRLVLVVLTGMGHDGTAGAAAVRRQGGHILAQDEATSVVWGMPGSVVKQGLADAVLPLHAIGPALRRLVESR